MQHKRSSIEERFQMQQQLTATSHSRSQYSHTDHLVDNILSYIEDCYPGNLAILLTTLLRGEAKLSNIQLAVMLGNTACENNGLPKEMKLFTFKDEEERYCHAYRDKGTGVILPHAADTQTDCEEHAQGTRIACANYGSENILYIIRTPILRHGFADRYELRYWTLNGQELVMTRTSFFQSGTEGNKFLAHARRAIGQRVFLVVAKKPVLS